ncbi:MAG TPA: dephospho-CoA kinase [Hyphomicrobiaceae bacterium]|nr:dephospho-CoA kinase [Hyphomicrobiaceae bacterium]
MLVIGLTGSAGMGKSTVAAHVRARGIPVFDADAEVHRLYEGSAVPKIEKAFPGTTRDGRVDRQKLSAALLRSPDSLRRLEAIVHPLVEAAERSFLHRCFAQGAAMAVLEIPLLFETGGDARVDVTIVVSAPAAMQRDRMLARPGMTVEKLDALLSRQLPDAEKRTRADFVIDTGGTISETLAQTDRIIEMLKHRQGSAFARCWA